MTTIDEPSRSPLQWVEPGAVPEPGTDVLLHDPRQAWVIEEGEVDLFVIQSRTDGPVARTRLATLDAASLVGGLPRRDEAAILARVARGSRLRPVRLDGPGERDVETQVTAAAVDRYVATVLGTLRSSMGNPDRHPLAATRQMSVPLTELPRDRQVLLERMEMARTLDEFAWVHASGPVRLLGRERERGLARDEIVPIGDADWLLCESDEATVTVHDTRDLLELGVLAEVLGTFGQELITALCTRIDAEERDERQALVERELQDTMAVDDSVRAFAAVLDGHVEQARARSQGPAYAAARIVGEHLGVAVQPPGAAARSAPRTDIVHAIAQASRLRTRQVNLADGWWKRDFGAMLGFLREGEQPVALVPGRGGYRVHDTEAGTVRKVDREIARELTTEGLEFSRPLPAEPSTPGQLLRFALRGSTSDIVVLVLTAFAVAALGLLVPILSGKVLGTLVPRAEKDLILDVCLLLVVAAIASAMLNAVYNLAGLRLEGRVDSRLQGAIWDRLMSLPASFFRDWSTGRLATAALGISEAREVLSGQLFRAGLAGVTVLANTVLVLVLDPRLGVLVILLVAGGLVVTWRSGTHQLAHQRVHQPLDEEFNSRTFQIITGVAKLATAAAEARGFAHWAEAFASVRGQTYTARRAQNRLVSFNAAYVMLGAAVAFVASAELFDLSRSTFIVFNVALLGILNAVVQISSTSMVVVEMIPAVEASRPILEAIPEEVETRADPGTLTGSVIVDGVSFSYLDDGSAPVLDNVSFRARAGEFVAIVGPSGCGKSTLLRLLLGFDDPYEGTIFYDGQDIGDLDPLKVRRQFGVVLQNARLFAGDILSNIVGSGLYTHEDAWAALRMVGMADEVTDMPMGINTVLSDGGWALSGGQRQRLLLARSLVTRPRILMLDEATSALDNRSQATVTASMARLDATRIVIAHRLSTIRDADRIVVMDAGKVVQEGTYDELIEEEGMFRKLARRQIA